MAAVSHLSFTYVNEMFQGKDPNITALAATLPLVTALFEATRPDPRTSEDCLFLDVIVPEQVLQKAAPTNKSAPNAALAPVLVWIYGGGYTNGDKSKEGRYDPSGLFKASQSMGNEGFVFVAMNYRVSMKQGNMRL